MGGPDCSPDNPWTGPHDPDVCGIFWWSDCPKCRERFKDVYDKQAMEKAANKEEQMKALRKRKKKQ